MGVPRFFRWIFTNYPHVVDQVVAKHHPIISNLHSHLTVSIDNYALDLNAIIHPITQKIYGKKKEEKEESIFNPKKLLHPPKLSAPVSYPPNYVYRAICNEIDKLVNIVSPKKRLIIAIDGIAGSAKQSQQRTRRFRSARDKTDEEFKTFDSNSISPGTEFLYNFSKYLHNHIKSQVQSDWKHLEVVFTNEKVVGEGEHKLIQLLKEWLLNGKMKHGESFCIHSPDADLIMLTLARCYSHLYILKENIYIDVFCRYLLIKIQELREVLINILTNIELYRGENDENKGESKEEVLSTTDKDNLIYDFITICFLFGNDFFNKLPSLELNDENMKIVLENYSITRYQVKSFLTKNGSLNINFLLKYLNNLAKDELNLIYSHSLKLYQENKLYNKNLSIDGKLDLLNYRRDYYKYKLGFKIHSEIDDLCKEYLKAMTFVLRYYTVGIPDWQYFFPYHYTPFIRDLYNTVKRMGDISLDFKFNINFPLSPFEQLLSILPKKSSNLLPEYYSKVMNHDSLKHLFPESFKIDYEGKKEEHEGIVLIPFMDIKKLLEITRKDRRDKGNKMDKSNEIDESRNKFGKIQYYNVNI